jgi:hypothetical protein
MLSPGAIKSNLSILHAELVTVLGKKIINNLPSIGLKKAMLKPTHTLLIASKRSILRIDNLSA